MPADDGERAGSRTCPSCTAPLDVGAARCEHCGRELAATPSVLTGVRAARECPRCRRPLARRPTPASATFDECPGCGGCWAERAVFELLVAESAATAGTLGRPHTARPQEPQSYVPCPDCRRLMNRLNFARCSGVIVDVCREHGTWLDRDELDGVLAFVRQGGLTKARARETEERQLDERRQRQERLAAAAQSGRAGLEPHARQASAGLLDGGDLIDVVAAVGSAVFDALDY